MTQVVHMQGVPFHFLSKVLNFETLSTVMIPLLIESHNLAPSYIKSFFCHEYWYYISTTLILRVPIIISSTFLKEHTMSISRTQFMYTFINFYRLHTAVSHHSFIPIWTPLDYYFPVRSSPSLFHSGFPTQLSSYCICYLNFSALILISPSQQWNHGARESFQI